MDSEVIRDQILFVSGQINFKMYGKSVKPPQPPDLWKSVTMPFSKPKVYVADKGDAIYRRSVYTFWKRGYAPPQMSIFNAPTRNTCVARRERTNTPLQALLLMNETEYFSAAKVLADKALKTKTQTDERIKFIYETITSKIPDKEEIQLIKEALGTFKKQFSKSPEIYSWTMIVNSLLNLDKVKTRE